MTVTVTISVTVFHEKEFYSTGTLWYSRNITSAIFINNKVVLFLLIMPMIPFRQRRKNWCEQTIDKCCTTEKWNGELKFWRLVWCEEVDTNLTSQLNRWDSHFLKSLHIETQYKTCISRGKIVSLQNCRWRNVNCKLKLVSLQNSNRTPAEAAVCKCSS